MIRRSHRTPRHPDPLALHRRLARRRDWQRRLTRGSAAALVGSLAAWLLGAPLAWQAGALLAAFALGLAWPVRDAQRWALALIGRETGLSYQTALERHLLEAPGGAAAPPRSEADGEADGGATDPDRTSDPYGFDAALRRRAAERARALRAPPQRAWWLPLLALALGLLLLPVVSLPRFGGGAGGRPAATDALGTPPQAPAERTPEALPEAPTEPEVRAPEAAGDGNADDGDPGDPNAGGAAGSDEAALSQYLDALREREPVPPPPPGGAERAAQPRPRSGDGAGEDGDRNPFSAVVPGTLQGDAPPDGGERGAQPPPPGAAGSERDADSAGSEGRSPESAAAPGEQPDAGAGEANPEGDEAAQDPGGDGDAGAPPSATGEESNATGAGDEAPASAPAPQAAAEAGAPAEQGGGGDENPAGDAPAPDQGDGAGGAPGVARPSEGLDASAPGEQSLLEGLLGRGPENPGGTVLLPGERDAVAPEGAAAASYRRAVERAITEGRIPLEYQEVIRNYFR